jgi:hypothetical protein
MTDDRRLTTVLERETGIEPATNSLEGCDSTTELLPPSRSPAPLVRASAGKPAGALSTYRSLRRTTLARRRDDSWPANRSSPHRATIPPRLMRAKVGGEGRTRTFEAARATDLQSAAFDRFATSPASLCFWKRDVSVVLKKARMFLAGCSHWSWRRDLNPRPADYKSAALPT